VGGTIEHLDPHSLEVDNAREYANLNKPFLDSIAEHGVLTASSSYLGMLVAQSM
jgi:hypothetical protein